MNFWVIPYCGVVASLLINEFRVSVSSDIFFFVVELLGLAMYLVTDRICSRVLINGFVDGFM